MRKIIDNSIVNVEPAAVEPVVVAVLTPVPPVPPPVAPVTPATEEKKVEDTNATS